MLILGIAVLLGLMIYISITQVWDKRKLNEQLDNTQTVYARIFVDERKEFNTIITKLENRVKNKDEDLELLKEKYQKLQIDRNNNYYSKEKFKRRYKKCKAKLDLSEGYINPKDLKQYNKNKEKIGK